MRLVAIGFAYTGENGARGAREVEGKVTRVGASKSGGERVSIKKKCRASCRGTLSCRNGMRISFLILR